MDVQEVTRTEVVTRQYKSRRSYDRDVRRMMEQGFEVQSMSTTESRRMLGCLFGLIGYWLLPKRTVFHVTYMRQMTSASVPS